MKIAYWITTALVALAYLAGGYFDIAQPPEMAANFAPLVIRRSFSRSSESGSWAPASALLLPGVPRLKEWPTRATCST